MADSPELAPAEKDVYKIVAAARWLLERVRVLINAVDALAANFPATTTDNAAARYNGTAGKLKNSAFIVDDNGHVSSFGGNIKFPTMQSASADANALDDYEEGTWTPVLTFATPGDLSVAYSTQVGVYSKIGREVKVRCAVITSTFTHTTASGDVRITGVPFNGAGNTSGMVGGTEWQGITKANYTQVAARGTGSGRIDWIASGSGVGESPIGAADMPTGGTVILAATLMLDT